MNTRKAKTRIDQANSRDVLGERHGHTFPRMRPEWRPHYSRLLAIREDLLRERGQLRQGAASEIPIGQMHPAESASDEFDHNLTFSLLSASRMHSTRSTKL